MKEKIEKWLHDVLGYGYPNGKYDKWSTSGCKYCNKTLDTDSTGASFHLLRRFNKKDL